MQPANSTGMEPRTTDDVSNTNNHCHCAAEADGGVRWFDLNGSKRDLLVEIYQLDQPSGQDIRGRMEAEHGEDVKAGRLYPNLNDLVDYGLLDKGEQDLRTNYYQITNDGQRLVEDTARYFESIGATSRVAADGGSTCEHCGFTTLNGWELRLVAADELDYDVRGYNALLCDDCREELRVDGGRRWRAPAVGQENNRLPICDYCGCFIEETDQPCAALHAGVCAP